MQHIIDLMTRNDRRRIDLLSFQARGQIIRLVANNYAAGDMIDDLLRQGAKWSLNDAIGRAIKAGGLLHVGE